MSGVLAAGQSPNNLSKSSQRLSIFSWKSKQSSGSTEQQRPIPRHCRDSLERDLFWQCLLFLCTFIASWSFMVLSQLEKFTNNRVLWIFISILTPLQGFNNWLVYVRPRAANVWKEYQERRRREATLANAPVPAASDGGKVAESSFTVPSGASSSRVVQSSIDHESSSGANDDGEVDAEYSSVQELGLSTAKSPTKSDPLSRIEEESSGLG